MLLHDSSSAEKEPLAMYLLLCRSRRGRHSTAPKMLQMNATGVGNGLAD